MKKFVLTLFFVLFLGICSCFADVIPLGSKSIKYYGTGVINMPKNFKVYQYPYKDSAVIKEVNFDAERRSAIVNTTDMRKLSFIAYVPSNKVALMTVEDVSENNWYYVYIDQFTGEKGWVYEEDSSAFMTYRELFYRYGKKYGLRMFSDLDKDEKILYSKESKDSKPVSKLTYPEFIGFTVIRGNWMLLSVNELHQHEKIGWFNWRNDDGTLNIFPNFKD